MNKIFVISLTILSLVFLFGCGRNKASISNSDIKNTEVPSSEFNWSTMSQGPYRDSLSFATSADLLTWEDSNLTLANHASVPGAVVKDGIIYLYFVDVNQDGVKEQIGLLTSRDNGKTWSARSLVEIEGLGNKAAVDPDPYLLEDGQIRLYYLDLNEQRLNKGQEITNKIYSAVSTDGVNFTEEAGVRFERKGIFDPDVIKVGDNWRLYLGDMEGNTLSATSKDGLIFAYEGKAFGQGNIPNAVYENNQYFLFTGGINISSSSSGKIFSGSIGSFHSTLGKITADPSVIKLNDGSFLLFFKYQK